MVEASEEAGVPTTAESMDEKNAIEIPIQPGTDGNEFEMAMIYIMHTLVSVSD